MQAGRPLPPPPRARAPTWRTGSGTRNLQQLRVRRTAEARLTQWPTETYRGLVLRSWLLSAWAGTAVRRGRAQAPWGHLLPLVPETGWDNRGRAPVQSGAGGKGGPGTPPTGRVGGGGSTAGAWGPGHTQWVLTWGPASLGHGPWPLTTPKTAPESPVRGKESPPARRRRTWKTDSEALAHPVLAAGGQAPPTAPPCRATPEAAEGRRPCSSGRARARPQARHLLPCSPPTSGTFGSTPFWGGMGPGPPSGSVAPAHSSMQTQGSQGNETDEPAALKPAAGGPGGAPALSAGQALLLVPVQGRHRGCPEDGGTESRAWRPPEHPGPVPMWGHLWGRAAGQGAPAPRA